MTTSKKTRPNAFFFDVYEVVKLIPHGRVTSYGAIAKYLGKNGAARMVGWAMFGCPAGVPAHRVVNSAGVLTGKSHFKTEKRMEQLLKKEGVTVHNDRIRNFKEVFWDPSTELL